jgi:hypothetical protein
VRVKVITEWSWRGLLGYIPWWRERTLHICDRDGYCEWCPLQLDVSSVCGSWDLPAVTVDNLVRFGPVPQEFQPSECVGRLRDGHEQRTAVPGGKPVFLRPQLCYYYALCNRYLQPQLKGNKPTTVLFVNCTERSFNIIYESGICPAWGWSKWRMLRRWLLGFACGQKGTTDVKENSTQKCVELSALSLARGVCELTVCTVFSVTVVFLRKVWRKHKALLSELI